MAAFNPEQIKWLMDLFGACAHIVNAQTPGDLIVPEPAKPGVTPTVLVCPVVTSHDVVSYKKLQEMLHTAYTESLEQAYASGTHPTSPTEVQVTGPAIEQPPIFQEVNIAVSSKE